jgi:hypothetical protein
MRGLHYSELAKRAEAHRFSVANVADHFVDRPNFQCLVRTGFEQRQQFLLAPWFFAQPFSAIDLREDGSAYGRAALRHALLANEKQLWTRGLVKIG